MDNRKKNISDLERKKQESQGSLNMILEDFGEILFSRIGEDENSPEDAVEYHRLGKEIAGSEGSIQAIEEDTLRLRSLEDEIEFKEQQKIGQAGELSGFYSKLGVLILSDPDYEVPAAAYQHQAESLISKIDSLEERLAELEDKDGNVFVLMGKSVQGLITRSSLKKNKNSLEQIYRSAGEQFSRDDAEVFETDGETAGLIGKIVKAKELSKNIEEELASLREERGKISGVFSAHGGPVKYIQELGKNISKARAAQKLIARRFGEAAYNSSAAGTKSAAKKKPFTDIVTGDDKQILEKIKLVRSTISDYDEQIKKLTAAIAIDEERAVIEKMQKSIADQKKRITAAEETITEAEGRIASSEKHISELEKDL